MKIKEMVWYEPLIWCIQKIYNRAKPFNLSINLPNGNQEAHTKVVSSFIIFNQIEGNDINHCLSWINTAEGLCYWGDLHSFFCDYFKGDKYFPKMLKEYREKNLQLDFDFGREEMASSLDKVFVL